jgi:hypothetical protein
VGTSDKTTRVDKLDEVKLLVDTDILIDVSRGITTAINRLKLEANTSTLAISNITYSNGINSWLS